jgi:hypothetical protein
LPVPLAWRGAAPADTPATGNVVTAGVARRRRRNDRHQGVPVLGIVVVTAGAGIGRRRKSDRRQGVEREVEQPGPLAAVD